jgi:hypothetical protein
VKIVVGEECKLQRETTTTNIIFLGAYALPSIVYLNVAVMDQRRAFVVMICELIGSRRRGMVMVRCELVGGHVCGG